MDNRNLILAVAFSVAILVGWDIFFPKPQPVAPDPVATATPSASSVPNPSAPTPAAAPTAQVAAPGLGEPVDVANLIGEGPRVSIQSARLSGSISLLGARFDDLILDDYKEHLDDPTSHIRLLAPKGGVGSYFAEFGWVGEGVAVPGADTLWTADRNTLSPTKPVTLSWDNGQGLTFERTIALDVNYLFSVTQRIVNTSGAPVSLNNYALVSRWGTPDTLGFFILHEGLIGVLDGVLAELDYDGAQEDGEVKHPSVGGWLGFTDKFWLTALIPDQQTAVDTRFLHRKDGDIDKYQTDYLGPVATVQPGGTVEVTNHLFAGAKEVAQIDGYEESLGVADFDKAIDFGWFYYLTKPIFYVLSWLNGVLGNFGLAILGLTVVIKLFFFPLANKSYVSMAKMRKLQPEIKKLQARFKDDKTRMNQELMGLYKKEKANPMAGCLPILIQIPVFFALYKVLFVSIEMRQAPFYGWVQDLSARDPLSFWNLFGLLEGTPLDLALMVPDMMNIGPLAIFMGFTMWLQQKLNPQPTDAMQAKIFAMLPIMFTFILAPFPAGLVIYWAWNNSLSILQQKIIMMRMGVD